MSEKRTRGLLLVGHGSHYNADSSEPARRQAAAIRALGVFDEVRTAFWKEEPALCHGVDITSADDIFVVPFFISSGYFTEQVVPREMELMPGLNLRGDRRVFYVEPVGTHATMTEVLLHRAETALEGSGVAPSDVSLFIVGHGTSENENSSAAVHAQVTAIGQLRRFAQVEAALMEEEPSHKTILSRASRPNVVIVPFFISDGLHSREDIPCDIGFMKRGESWKNPVRFQGKTLWYTRAAGLDPRMTDVILERVREVQNPEARTHSPRRRSLVGNPEFIHTAYRAFLKEVTSKKALLFGQLWITSERGKIFSIRHEQDRSTPDGSLKIHASPFDNFDIGRLTADGKFRPLKSAATLPAGWTMPNLNPEVAMEALEFIYPAAVVHWYRQKNGALHVRSYRETAERQSGLYEVTKKLTDRQVNEAIKRCCIDRLCMKEICWPIEAGKPVRTLDIGHGTLDSIPCPEPCSLLMSDARRVLKLKPEPPAE